MAPLWLLPALPLLGFLVLVASEGRLPRWAVSVVGAGSVGLAALAAVPVTMAFAALEPSGSISQILWTWIHLDGFAANVGLRLDGLSLTLVWVATGVGSLILLYATGYMAEEEGYSRFFAYMDLFVFAMLTLVLADNLLLLYLGWEGVGLCSYLLIGFFQHDPANGYAARKAFVMTRLGDVALLLGLFLLFRELGTLQIHEVLTSARATWPHGSSTATLAALLILGGAVGKSAQLPLQTWLPDAMAGPTPVSALIHAATMVTAGVYLIARLHGLFLLSPTALTCLTLVGLVTLFIAAFAALAQRDIKRILAYSTMSQIGYMFFGLGVGAWSASIFHLLTHAFFKALLFLSAGMVSLALNGERDIFRMGGLWRRLPWPFAGMVIGCAALAALPLTSGYYSKDAIVEASHQVPGGAWMWGVAAFTGLLTALYSARLVFRVFFGPASGEREPDDRSGFAMRAPMVVLCLLALGGGWFGMPPVRALFPGGPEGHGGWVAWVTGALPVIGAVLGWLIFVPGRLRLADAVRPPAADLLRRFWLAGWGFDWLYRRFVEQPFVAIARLNRNDAVNGLFDALATLVRGGNTATTATQNGRLRWYLANMAAGTAVVLLIVLVVR